MWVPSTLKYLRGESLPMMFLSLEKNPLPGEGNLNKSDIFSN